MSASTAVSDWDVRRLRFQANMIGDKEDEAMEAVGLPPSGRVLDVGCGPGEVSRRLHARWPGLACDGLEVHPGLVEHARRCMRRVHHCDIGADAWPVDGRHDAVFARLVLRHVADPRLVVQRMVEATRPGGTVVFIDPLDDTLHVEPAIDDLLPALAACRRVVRSRSPLADPRAGDHLEAFAAQAGLKRVERRDVALTTEDCAHYDGDDLIEGWTGPRGFVFFLAFLRSPQFTGWPAERCDALGRAMDAWAEDGDAHGTWSLSIVGGRKQG